MNPLIIVATPNISWLHPDVSYPQTDREIADEARRCLEAGAAVLHTHAEGRWSEVITTVREECDIIIQCGMSSLAIPDRMSVYEAQPDMISVILNHHDEAFARIDVNVLHPREELEDYARLSSEYGVKPEFEMWHAGSIWNLRHLISRELVRPPYITTLFLGWPGGTWSPPTIDEYLYRRRLMPERCVVAVSVMDKAQLGVLAAAIVQGDHVRVGTEDHPFRRDGQVGATHELVAEVAQIAQAVGRPIATVESARQILGLRDDRQ